MGNRVLLNSLHQLHIESLSPATFGEIIFAAPDVDEEVFKQKIGAAILLAGKPAKPEEQHSIHPESRVSTSMYANTDDKALAFSKWIHKGLRAGEDGDIEVDANIDIIMCKNESSGTFSVNHSYIFTEKLILEDMAYKIKTGTPASMRANLVPDDESENVYHFEEHQIKKKR